MDKKHSEDYKDVELGSADVKLDMSSPHMYGMMEAAALLTIWSLLVINEGSIRFNETAPSAGITQSKPDTLPNVILFISSLGEVLFGLLGLAVGIAAFFWRAHSPSITKIAMIIQTLLGYLVFVIYVFLVPAYRAHNAEVSEISGVSLGTFKFLITLGILTSFHFCLALQGGQFIFMARLVAAATGQNFLMQQSGNKMRAIFWNLNMALSGLWTLITGAILVNAGTIDGPFEFPPNVGTVPGFTVFTGLVLLIWGLAGAGMGVTEKAPIWYYFGSTFTFLIAFLNFGIAQFGTFLTPANAPVSAPIAMHNGLVFVVVWLGPYFVKKNEESLHKH